MSQETNSAETPMRRQYVNFGFYQVDPAWRRLPAKERTQGKHEFCEVVKEYMDTKHANEAILGA